MQQLFNLKNNSKEQLTYLVEASKFNHQQRSKQMQIVQFLDNFAPKFFQRGERWIGQVISYSGKVHVNHDKGYQYMLIFPIGYWGD